MDFIVEMQSAELEVVIDSMNAYAIGRLKTVGLKDFDGKEPIDFVGDLILKIAEGDRDWGKAKCSFKEFLFGCLKSDIGNFLKTKKSIHTNEFPDIPSNDQTTNYEEEKKSICLMLKLEGADSAELAVFECWMDGITKPAEVANNLGEDVKEIYKITKRIERRLPRIKSLVTKSNL